MKLHIVRVLLIVAVSSCCRFAANATGEPKYVSVQNGAGYFDLATAGIPAPLYVSADDYPGVIRAMKDLQTDIASVTGNKPKLFTGNENPEKQVVLVGTIGKSTLIDGLIKTHKLDVSGITGKWENFILQTVQNPMPGVSSALVIAGSDKGG